MSTQTRRGLRNWFTAILLGLVGLSMVIFLIPGGLDLAPSQHVARVGDRTISPVQLSRELDLTLRAQRREGNNISQQEAIEGGVHLRLLEALITRNALYGYAEKLGVSASDTLVAERIRQIPAVQNPLSNAFDEGAYLQFLQDYGYSQAEFENDMRGDLTSEMLRQALTIGTRAPNSYGALALAFESETRVVTVAEAPMSLAGAIPNPSEAQVQDFYEDNSAALQIPEFRALTLVFADPNDFVARVDVPEARLHEEFEARRGSLASAERRTYLRLAAQNEAQAQDAARRLSSGESPNSVASSLGMQLTRGDNQTREQVADAPVREAVFSAVRNEVRAVRASLSPWAVVRVEAITPGQTADFDSLRDQLRQEIALEEAGALLDEAIGAFEDARASGTGLAEAARNAGLRSVSVPTVSAQGLSRDGAPVPLFAANEDLLSTAFETAEGEASDFLPAGEGVDAVVGVDQVIPASTRPLEEVRDQLVEGWRARERGRRMNELADELRASVAQGQAFAAAARARGMNVAVTSRPIDRQSASQLPARQLGARIFSAAEGGVVSDFRVDGGALVLAQVEDIRRVDPAEQPQLVEAARVQFEETLRASLDEAIAAQVVADTRPTRNERVLGRLFSSGGQE